ncbi:MAG: hypothetical protein LBT05_15650 [Planctomycetaceae bacterium]|jgi:hypothetical protein|nr:hypothetical protein [Planctomycetaceae bacterium]
MKQTMKQTLMLALIAMLTLTVLPFSVLSADEPLDARFAKADANKDGKLDQQEFKAFLVYLNTLKLAKPVKKTAPPTETELRYEKSGSYLQSAMGYVPVKSIAVPEKSGGCCGGKMKAAETENANAPKSGGGCCGGGKTEK